MVHVALLRLGRSPDDLAALHHKIDVRQCSDIRQGIRGRRYDVGEKATSDLTELVLHSDDVCRVDSRRFDSLARRYAAFDIKGELAPASRGGFAAGIGAHRHFHTGAIGFAG